MKTTVIHHSADYDGIFCREIARKFLPDAELIGWDYGNPLIPFPEGQVYVLDLSPDCFSGFMDAIDGHKRLVWIDHHKSALEKFDVQHRFGAGYRIDGVAACRLAWQWFTTVRNSTPSGVLFPKRDFIERNVGEPLAVRLAGEYDIWDHRGDGDVEFQFGLDSEEHLNWEELLSNRDGYAKMLVENGRAAMQCYKKRDADIMLGRSFTTEWEGLKFLCLNTARCNSNSFLARDLPSTGHDALLAFYWNGSIWTVSMYHANHRKDIDLSQIAVKYGGGGHRGACGFRVKNLPFLT